MAIETRANGKQYYYRSRRVDGRVVREYIAAGQEALIAAEAASQERQQRGAVRAAELRELDQINAALEPLEEFTLTFDSLLKATLLASGFHNHKGQWRQKHGHGSSKNTGAYTGAVA